MSILDKIFSSKFFTWWNGDTIGTRLFTSREGHFVGEDDLGNSYYRNGDDTRRWVVFNGYSEASAVSADWHGWLHHTFEEPPTEAPLQRWSWEKDHKANMTGTDLAYRPAGSLMNAEPERKTVTGDYAAWSPE